MACLDKYVTFHLVHGCWLWNHNLSFFFLSQEMVVWNNFSTVFNYLLVFCNPKNWVIDHNWKWMTKTMNQIENINTASEKQSITFLDSHFLPTLPRTKSLLTIPHNITVHYCSFCHMIDALYFPVQHCLVFCDLMQY